MKEISKSSIIWNTIGIICNSFYSLIITIFIAQISLNGIEITGEFSYAFYVGAVLSTIGNYGGRLYQVSDIKTLYKEEEYISLKYLSSFIMILIALVFILFNGYDFNKIILILFFVIYRIFESISEAYYGVMQKNNSLKNIGISMTIKSLLSIVLFVILFLLTNNLLTSSMSFTIVFFLTYILYDKRYCKKYNIKKITINNKTKELLKKCFPLFLNTFLNLFILNISRYFVDLRCSDTIEGYFNILILPASLLTLFIQFLLQPLLKKLVDTYKEESIKGLKVFLNKIIKYYLFLSLLILICSYFLGVPILNFIYKTNLNHYKLQLLFIIFAGLMYGIANIYSTALTIIRKINIQVIIYLISIFIIFIMSFIYIKDIYSAINIHAITLILLNLLFFIEYKKEVKDEK